MERLALLMLSCAALSRGRYEERMSLKSRAELTNARQACESPSEL